MNKRSMQKRPLSERWTTGNSAVRFIQEGVAEGSLGAGKLKEHSRFSRVIHVIG